MGEGSTPDSKSGESAEVPSLKQWVYEHFGRLGLIILSIPVLVGGSLGFYEHWHNVQTLAPIHKIVCLSGDWLPKSGLEKADPKRFSVAIAHFENDKDEALEGDLKEALSNFDATLGVQPLEFDRLICLQGHTDEAAEALGKRKAHQYLAESRADVLIWGVVRDVEGKNVARVYLTASEVFRSAKKPFVPQPTEQAFDLPEDLRIDISDVLSLAIASQSAQFYGKGQYVADKLAPFIGKVQKLIQSNTGLSGEALARVRVVLANGLSTVGQQSGNNEDLKEAIEEYRQALAQIDEGSSPLVWANAKYNLGVALVTLGERESGTKNLDAAVKVYQEALKKQTREKMPQQWAATQNNLGIALESLGERESGDKNLNAAVEAYEEALKERTRDKVPLDWAVTQNDLGNALLRLGERESGTKSLNAAVEAYREALKEFTRDKVPLDWAAIQNNLGSALETLGERESGTKSLDAAVEAFHEALKERTRDKVPLKWAASQNNLGNALETLGERESGTESLDAAVKAYREALVERTRDRVPLDWAVTQNNLGSALRVLGERESGTKSLNAAVEAYREALKESTRNKVPLQWAATQYNLGAALEILGKRKRDPSLLCQALQSDLDAWEVSSAGGDIYRASKAAGDGLRQISLLGKSTQASQSCVTKHAVIIERMKAWKQQQPADVDLN